MLRYKTRISVQEKTLLDTIQEIGHGEIYSPRLQLRMPLEVDAEVSLNSLDLLSLMRSGVQISILTIHAGEPTFAEIDEAKNGFRCRKKLRFPKP